MHFFSSLKNCLYFFAAALILQAFIVAMDISFQHTSRQLQENRLNFTMAEQSFLLALILEQETEKNPANREILLSRYLELTEDDTTLEENHTQLIKERISTLDETYALFDKRQKLYENLNSVLPKLMGGVSYIHSHHLAYLKNLIRRGTVESDYDIRENYPLDNLQPASELDIIAAAIEIHNSMLTIVEIFSRLQRGFSPASVNETFNIAMVKLYDRTNVFEELSLDAQDGLLVEEIITNGRLFEDSFTSFIEIEQSIVLLKERLSANQQNLVSQMASSQERNRSEFVSVQNNLQYIKVFSLIIGVAMLVTLLFITQRIILALRITLSETGKIEKNHLYRIPQNDSIFKEFKYIFNALNNMGQAIGRQISELGQARSKLEEQVAQRTESLSAVNQQLRQEIIEREKNIEQKHQLEERLARAEKMEAIGTLAGGVAHDLNNILSGIVSYPELILMDIKQDDPHFKALQTIKTSGERASVIVEDLLTMARRGVAKFDIVDLNLLVDEFRKSNDLQNILAHAPQVRVQWDINAKFSIILGSKVHLLKSLVNLVTNCVESINDEGTLEIINSNVYIDTVIRGYDQVVEGEYVKLTVKDTGAGISQENLDRIFEPFFTTKTMGRSGSGLGMAVVWGTIKDHRGYIDVKSKENQGSSFDLYFPLFRGTSYMEDQNEDEQLDGLYGESQTVLVIDDVLEQREIATMMLERLGYAAKSVRSGEEAVALIEQGEKPDVLLLDMIMDPGMNGLETYKKISQHHPGQRAVIVSGFSESEHVREAQKLGTGPYLKKPYTLGQLAKALHQVLHK